ncbi:MAG: DUF4177 domain-containing protein [Burkholderiales bacterium]|nr:DUF4177 domain-containing protein [Burkholderiales bacterium]
MKWEYKIIHLNVKRQFWTSQFDLKTIENALNDLGQQGWELVSLHGMDNRYAAKPSVTLKRAL